MTEPERAAQPEAAITMTRRQAAFADWVTDVFVYIVVINLFVEYAPAVIIESFSLSILTAILMKLMLDAITRFEHRIVGFFRSKEGVFFQVMGTLAFFTILAAGKLLILEVVNIVFGDEVQLGHFVEVLVLIVAMMVARELVQRVYKRLGE
jgi:hypothetical protein